MITRITNQYEYTNMKKLKRMDLIYPQLSYRIVGALFDVYNNLGPGYSEKYYQRAIAEELKRRQIPFRQEIVFPLTYKDTKVGVGKLDFLIADRVILELKRSGHFSKRNIEQIYDYLRLTKKQLAIFANFTSEGVIFRRIINSYIRNY